MNEISKVLESKEKIIWEGKPNFKAYIFSSILISLLISGMSIFFIITYNLLLSIIVALALLILTLILANLNYKVTDYAITNKRIIIQKGIIGRDFTSVDYDNIQNSFVSVGIIGVIFKVGSVKIFSGKLSSQGSGNNKSIRPEYDTFSHIEKPYEVLKLLQEKSSSRKESLYSGKA